MIPARHERGSVDCPLRAKNEGGLVEAALLLLGGEAIMR
jgi:hypothetical protein